jgi:hypothetical protein
MAALRVLVATTVRTSLVLHVPASANVKQLLGARLWLRVRAWRARRARGAAAAAAAANPEQLAAA